MTRTVYVNGEYLPEQDASISIFDRGFLMADAVYEVTTVLDGKLVDFDGHLRRLNRSLSELKMIPPKNMANLLEIHRELVKVNRVQQGMVYLQISRGPADRDFVFPSKPEPSLVLFTQEKDIIGSKAAHLGIKVISIEDLRWGRRDIKTVQLLYSSMCKTRAISSDCDDAWMVQDGYITEGTSNNAYIVKDNIIITRELSNDILHGITRASVLRYAEDTNFRLEERRFTVREAQDSDEAFITSASNFVTPVVEIDGMKVNDGSPGPVTMKLRDIYIEESRKRAV